LAVCAALGESDLSMNCLTTHKILPNSNFSIVATALHIDFDMVMLNSATTCSHTVFEDFQKNCLEQRHSHIQVRWFLFILFLKHGHVVLADQMLEKGLNISGQLEPNFPREIPTPVVSS